MTSFKAKTKNIILNTNNIAPKKSFYELEAISLDGKKISFDQYFTRPEQIMFVHNNYKLHTNFYELDDKDKC